MSQAIVERACAKLRSALGDEAVVRSNFTADIRDMLEALEAIQPVLYKTEMRPLRDRSTAVWLQRAVSAAYRTIDIVDELQDTSSQAAATMTKRILARLVIIKNAMVMEVQETKEILMRAHDKCRELSDYLAKNTMLQEIIEERKTRPVFEEAMVLGRGPDKERIIATLLSTEPNIMQEHTTILPIFGLAVGKTTLAQMVFNDAHSLQGYDFRVWVHVSPQFDFHTSKSIVCHVSGRGQEEINRPSSDVEGMESMMKRLHMLLNGKKVLLALDNLWEEDPIQLQLLKSMLTFLGDKMDVIVTTCNQAIARKICSIEPYRLSPLSDEACWEIIKRNSIHFEGGEEELEKIGREIASKCWGVPSVARRYARMLYSCRDALTWKETIEMSIWSKKLIYNSILSLALPSFELSCRSMPPDLRLCFAYYCQVFPNGHNIVKEDLVHHWIALHLVEPTLVEKGLYVSPISPGLETDRY